MKPAWRKLLPGQLLLLFMSLPAYAGPTLQAYELLYDEQEQGTDVFRNRYLVTDRYIKIEEIGDDGGYILFDNNSQTIYSVSHFNQAILVIRADAYQRPAMQGRVSISYEILKGSPKISGKQVYNYRVSTTDSDNETCMDLQLAEGLLPEITGIFSNYQQVVASQQAKMLPATPPEYQTTCFLYDQVFNEGLYYEKGLPVQEWHSNGRKKLLISYQQIELEDTVFDLPGGYREYSVD